MFPCCRFRFRDCRLSGEASYGDPAGIFLGVLTIAVIVLLNRFGKGALREMSILIGLIVATTVAVVMDMVNFGPGEQCRVVFVCPSRPLRYSF